MYALLARGVRQSVYLPWSLLSPTICLLSLDLLRPVSLPHKRDMCSMLRVSVERVDERSRHHWNKGPLESGPDPKGEGAVQLKASVNRLATFHTWQLSE